MRQNIINYFFLQFCNVLWKGFEHFQHVYLLCIIRNNYPQAHRCTGTSLWHLVPVKGHFNATSHNTCASNFVAEVWGRPIYGSAFGYIAYSCGQIVMYTHHEHKHHGSTWLEMIFWGKMIIKQTSLIKEFKCTRYNWFRFYRNQYMVKNIFKQHTQEHGESFWSSDFKGHPSVWTLMNKILSFN